jgi:hypothetical protein
VQDAARGVELVLDAYGDGQLLACPDAVEPPGSGSPQAVAVGALMYVVPPLLNGPLSVPILTEGPLPSVVTNVTMAPLMMSSTLATTADNAILLASDHRLPRPCFATYRCSHT